MTFLLIFLVASCSKDALLGKIEVSDIVNPDSMPPLVEWITVPGNITGATDLTLEYIAVDDPKEFSGLKSLNLYYSPNVDTEPFVLLGTIPQGNNTIPFCVPNKNHPKPTFKIVAIDNNNNKTEALLGDVAAQNFTININNDPIALPTVTAVTSHPAGLTKLNPTHLNLDLCAFNSCSASALKMEDPTNNVFVMANTTAVQPLATDPNWVACDATTGFDPAAFGADGPYTLSVWIKSEDKDFDNITDIKTVSASSQDVAITFDSTAPIDGPANPQFTNSFEMLGDNIPVSWTTFTDMNVVNHRIKTYTDSSCLLNEVDHGLTSSNAITDSAIVDGLSDGTYYMTVTAIDHVGLETTSACSTDSVQVDTTPPVDNGANLQFTDTFDNDGNDIAVTWTAFSDLTLTNHRLKTYTNSSCTTGLVDHSLTGSSTNSDAAIIDGLGTGYYWAKVSAIDNAGNVTESACSTDFVHVDVDSPIDNGANLQFTDVYDIDGNSIAVSWVAFTDGNGIADHQLYTFTDSACTLPTATGVDHGLTGSATNSNSTIITGLADGQYWGKVRAFDTPLNSTLSACSTDSIIVDSTNPVDNTADLQFTVANSPTNNNIAVTWTAFTDATLTDHQLYTYTDSGCTTGVVDHGLTGSTTNSNSTIINGLSEGQKWGQVKAIDALGHVTLSACSTDSILIDTIFPVDNGANLQFTNNYTTTGNNVAVTWTGFTDINLSDHRLKTYTDAACTLNLTDHGLTASSASSDSTIINGLSIPGKYYAKVTAYDLAGNFVESACSTDFITFDSTPPTDNTANVQFTDTHDIDGNNIALTWTAFTDTNGISDHQLYTYTDSACTLGEVAHGLTGSGTNADSTSVGSLADGTYWAKVRAYDAAGLSTLSACSTDSIIVDSTAPIDNTANLQFTLGYTNVVNDIAVTWTAFTDATLTNHDFLLFTDSACTLPVGGTPYGPTGSATNSDAAVIDGLAEGEYWGKVTATDFLGLSTTSACSTDSIVVDLTNPVDAGPANLQFTNAYSITGNNVAVTWTAFTDTYMGNHRLKTYTDAGCTLNATDHGLTGSATNSDAAIIDGLTIEGPYYAKVTAYDLAGNFVESACSTDSIILDLTPPTDNVANVQFTDTHDIDGNDLAVTWTAFTDLNGIGDYEITTYTNSACSTGAVTHPKIGSNATSDAVTVDGLADGTYWAKVTAYDSGGNFTTSACSTDSIIVDSTAPIGTANLQFTLAYTNVVDNIAVTWTAFSDLTLENHQLYLFTDSGCTLPSAAGTDYGLTGSNINSDNVIIDGLLEGQYWGKVKAIDHMGFTTLSPCSTDTLVVDLTDPVDNTADVQFTNVYDLDGNDIPVTWTAFTDTYLSDHRIKTYTDSACTLNLVDHGLTGSATNSNSLIIDGLTDNEYWTKITAYDLAGNFVESACSTDSVIVDTIPPTDNGADLQFTDLYDVDGNDIAVTWTAFTDTNNIGNHQIVTYTDSACTLGAQAHPLTGSGTSSDSLTIDGLVDGQYWAKVIAHDNPGNTTTSACSTDSITVDSVAPSEAGITVVGTVVTAQSYGKYNLSSCTDIAMVKITRGAGAPPLDTDPGWQTCDQTGYTMTTTDLIEGANNLQFWIKDAAGNVQTAFIPHMTIYNPPTIVVENGPTVNTDVATMTIDYCAEADIKEVLFNETDIAPAVGDPTWQTCSTAVGALLSASLTPGDHILKAFFKYNDDSISINSMDVPVRYEPSIIWEESPVRNRPQLTFTLGSCTNVTHVLFNQSTVPLDTDPAWQGCTITTSGLTHDLTAEGAQTLNVWYKNGTTVYPDYSQVNVNFDAPTATIFGGGNIDTNSPKLSVDDCNGVSRVFVKVDEAVPTAPLAADFTGAGGQDCTTALNGINTPVLPDEGPHTIDVWFYFSDTYILDPWYSRVSVTYTAPDVTPPPITGPEGAATPLSITLENGDGGTPPLILNNGSRAHYTLNTCQPNPPVAVTGTVSIGAGTSAVVGVGSSFTTEFATGDFINISGEVLKVKSVTDNTHLDLYLTHVAGASGVAATKEYPLDLITGMILTESAVAPASDDPDWLACSTVASDFKTKTLTPDGDHNLYAWFKDAAGNLSATSLTDTVRINTGSDTTPPPRPPVIVEGAPILTTAPAYMTVTSCTDVDQVYLEPSVYPSPYVAPSSSATGWQNCTEGVGDIVYQIALKGSYTISVWFKDAAGNINPTPRDVSFIFDPVAGVFSNPLAYWTMDKVHKMNSQVLDIKGDNHLNMWDKDNLTEVTGKSSEALNFSGTNSLLVTNNDVSLKPTISVAMSMWAYLTASDAGTKGLAGAIEDGVGGYGFRLEGGNLKFFASGQSTSIATSSYTTGWHHMIGTSDGRYIKIFLDGQLKNTFDMGAAANLTYGCSQVFAVGATTDCTANPVTTNLFDNKIDEVVVWAQYLTDQEALNHYIDTYNDNKVNEDAVAAADISTTVFYGEMLQNALLTINDCAGNKFVYVNETTHPPLVDSPDWQLCNTVKGGIIHPNLTQGPHELKIWGKDEYNNITAGYQKVDTTITGLAYQAPGLLYYTFDNNQQNLMVAQDIFSKQHATTVGADVNQVAIQNEGFLFVRANSDYVERKYSANSQPKNEVTLSIWADLTASDNRKQVLAGNRMASHGYSIEIDDLNSELRFYVETAAGTRESGISTASFITGFHNIIGTYDGQVTTLYMDGAVVDTFDHGSISPIVYTCLSSFMIGAGNTCNNGPVSGTHFDNELDEVVLWDKALTAPTIYDFFNGQDTVPPLPVAVTPKNNNYTIGIPIARFNVSDCNDIGSVYISLDPAQPPGDVANWQTCATTGDTIKSPLLADGANNVYVWFKDVAGNVSTTSTDLVMNFSYDFTIPTPDSYWTMNDVNMDGAVVYDVTSGKNGNNNNSAMVTGTTDEALNLNGTDSYIEVNYDAVFQPSNTVTLSAWFKVAAFDAADHMLVGNYDGAGGYGLYLGNNTVEFRVQALGALQTASYSTAALSAGAWNHVAGVFDGGQLRLFVNGVEVNSPNIGAAVIQYANTNSLIMGATPTTTTGPSADYLTGTLDEVAFWNSALTDTVIAEIYNRGVAGDLIYYDVTAPTIPVALDILYYNSLVSRANLTVTDCTGLDYIIVTKDDFPPDKNDEDWQLCNTLTGGLLSKELDPADTYGKLWTKDLFGNISKVFEYVPLVTNYDKPISRPVVHWTFDSTHYLPATREVFDRISQINLKNDQLLLVDPDPLDTDLCTKTQVYDDTAGTVTLGGAGVLNEGIDFAPGKWLRSDHPANAKLKPTDKLSVAAWVYLTGSTSHTNDHIISTEFNGKGWAIRLDAVDFDDKGLRFTVHTAGGTLEPYLETKNYTTGWHLVIGTYDGQKASMYFDGIFVKSFSNASPQPIVYEPGVNMIVGAAASTGLVPTSYIHHTMVPAPFSSCVNSYPTNSYFTGKIDEIIVWDKVLNGLEASSLYHNGADLLYPTDTTPPANPTLALENSRPNIASDKAFFTVSTCNDISGVLVNEGTQPDKQDDRWEVCRQRLGSFGIEGLTPGGHTITAWMKDLAGNVTPVSSDLVVDYVYSAAPNANAFWPLDASASVAHRSRDIVDFGLHDLVETNIDTPLNPGATHVAAKAEEGIMLSGSKAYLTAPTTKLLRPVNFLTVGGWFYLTVGDDNKVLIDQHEYTDDTNRGGYKLYFLANRLRFKTELDIARTIEVSVANNSYTTGWHHVLGVWTGWEVELFLDNTLVATSGALPERDFLRYDDLTHFRIGAESDDYANPISFFNEKVDEIGVWGFDMNPTQMTNTFDAGNAGTHIGDPPALPLSMDNAFVYHYDNFGSRARMTILDCTGTPWIYVTEQGGAVPLDNGEDWRECVTDPGGILSAKLPLSTTYVDVYVKDAYGNIAATPATKEIFPVAYDYDLPLPISYTSFNSDHISGTTVKDFMSNLYGGLVNGVGTATNPDGDELVLDGVDDYVNINTNSIFDIRNGISFALWADITNGTTATQYLVGRFSDVDDTALLTEAGYLRLRMNVAQPNSYTRGTSYPEAIYPTSLIPTGKHFFVGSYDGQKINLYMDSVLVASQDVGYLSWAPATNRSIVQDTVNGFRLSSATATDVFGGNIDEFMVFDRILTETEIVSHYRRYKDMINAGDTTPPATVPGISVFASTFGANWPTDNANPMYSLDNCTDIAGVFINLDGAPAPAVDDAGWQTCLTDGAHLEGPILSAGVHTVQFWFKDANGNVTTSSQDIVVDYTVPALPNPVAYWSMDDDSFVGRRIYEPVNQLHGYLYESNVVAGKVGTAAGFDGSRKYIEVEHDPIIKPVDELTIAFWVNIPSANTSRYSRYIMSNRGSSAEGFYFRWKCDSGTPSSTTCTSSNEYFEFLLNVDGIDRLVDVPTGVVGTGWQHITATFDGRYIRLYKNASLIREKDLGGDGVIHYDAATNTSLVFGAEVSAIEKPSGGYFPGSLDEVAIYNTALYPAQISDLYNNFSNNNTRIYDPGLAVITPPNTRGTIHNKVDKSFGSRLRITMSDCTNTNMILVSDSTTAPAANDENWQPCNTYAGGILSAPLAPGVGVVPRIWAKSFTGTISAASGIPNADTYDMPTFATDIPRPMVHWSLDSAASGYTSGNNIYDSLSWSHGLLDALTPPETTATSGGLSVIEEGYSFNGVDELISIHPTSATNPMYDISISAWVELLRGETQYRHIVGNIQNGAAATGAGSGLRIKDGELQFYVTAWTGSIQTYVVGIDSNIYSSGLHHVTGTYDGRDLTLYLDGVFVNRYPVPLYSAPRFELYHDDYSHWTIGAETDANNLGAPGSFFQGVIDDIRIWRTALTEQQVYYAYDYGADFIPTNTGDGIAPTDPGIFLADGQTTSSMPWVLFTMPTCTGANGIEVNAIYVNLDTDPAPNPDDVGWQYCTLDAGYVTSQLLDIGNSNVTVYFRDEEGDISSATTFPVNYDPPGMINPFAYYSFDTDDRSGDYFYYDLAGTRHIRGSAHLYSPIRTGVVSTAFMQGVGIEPHPNNISKTYAHDYAMTKDFSLSFWYKSDPDFALTSDQLLVDKGQFRVYRTASDTIKVEVSNAGTKFSYARLKEGTWTHIGVTRKGGTLKIFINGKLDSSHGIWNSNLGYSAANMTIASCDGYYDEVVFYDSAITDAQMAFAYHRGVKGLNVDVFPVNKVTAPTPQVYFNFDDSHFSAPILSDVMGGINMSEIEPVGSGDIDAKVGQSFHFTRKEMWIDTGAGEDSINILGDEQFLESSTASPVSLGSDFTIATWVKMPVPSGHNDDDTSLLDLWGVDEEDQQFSLGYSRGSGRQFYFSLRKALGNDNQKTVVSSWDTFNTNTSWVHVVMRRKGREFTMFINGIQSGTMFWDTTAPLLDTSTVSKLRIGDSNKNRWEVIPGKVDVTAGTDAVVGTGTTFTTDLIDLQTGTVDVTAGTALVVGTGTTFTTEFVVGSYIKIGTEFHQVLTITDDTNMELVANHVAGATGEAIYKTKRVRIGTQALSVIDITDDTHFTLSANHVDGATNSWIKVLLGPGSSDEFGFNGNLDEMAIWDSALTQNQVYEIYQRGNSGVALGVEPQVIAHGTSNTTGESQIQLTLNDCNNYTDVWVGFAGDIAPLSTDVASGPYNGWVSCTDLAGGINSPTLTVDSVNNLRLWFKTGAVVSVYTADINITHVSGDTTPPVAPIVTQETASPTSLSFARYTLSTCTDINGVFIQHAGAAPTKDQAGWINCTTVNSALTSPVLNSGPNTISFYFKDAAGNVTSNTDKLITHNLPLLPDPNLYFTMDDAQLENNFQREIIGRRIASGNNTANMTTSLSGVVAESIEFLSNAFYEIWQDTFSVTNDLTFSGWVNISAPATAASLINKWDETQAENKYAVLIDSTGRICLDFQTVNSTGVWNTSTYKRSCSVDKIAFAEWNHVGVIKSGGTINFYSNAKNIGSETVDTGNLQASTLPTRIGAQVRGGSNKAANGQIDELAVWTSALTTTELEGIYAEGLRGNELGAEIQPQAAGLPSFYWNFDATQYESTTAKFLDPVVGSISMENKFLLGPAYATIEASGGQVADSFNFANDHYFESDANSLNLGTQFAISTWVKLIDDSDDLGTILNKWNSLDVNEQEFRLYTSSRFVKFSYHTTATDVFTEVGFDTLTSASQITYGAWTHIMVTRDGDDLRMYINGVLSSTKSMGTNPMKDVTTIPLRFGGEDPAGAVNFLTGSLDEIVFYKQALHERQVQTIYDNNALNTASTTTVQLSVAHPSSTVNVTPAKLTIGSCNGYAKILIQDSALAAPAAAAITTNCDTAVGAHDSSALPATGNTVHVYFGDGASVVDGPYPITINYVP